MSSGSAPTSYTYTGQYSNTADFGLMFYNARWYDPGLGRMAQADGIVPRGVQGYDRYAYANNSPLVFTDPTGHFGKHNDEKSDYWNRRNQQKVKSLEEKWRVEEEEAKALVLLQSLFRQTWKELALDPALGVAGAFVGGKPLFGMGGQGEPPPPVPGVNVNAIIDPLAWEHIAGAMLGGVVMIGFGVVMIRIGAGLCTSVIGCAAGIPLAVAGVAAIGVGGVFIYSGYRFGEVYYHDIFGDTP